MHTVFFLAELNNIETRTCDISNSYLTERTTEKIVFIIRPEFEPLGNVGHLLMIKTALYFLKIYGSRFHYCLSDDMTSLGFIPSMRVCNIWMSNEGNYYAYMACYWDDLIFIHKDPDNVFYSIQVKEFTIKKTSDTE